jgi:O-antigen/teichoic acid export membrane protein
VAGVRACRPGLLRVVRQSTKLILNTVVTYGRMLVTVGMGLMWTRLALRELPGEDFGIWAGLTTVVGLSLMLSDGVNNAGDRFLAFELGRGDHGRIRATFRTLLAIFLTIAGLTVVAGAAATDAILAWAQVPEERLEAVRPAVMLTVGYTVLVMLVCPFRSMLISRQSMVLLSGLEIFDAAARLGLTALALARPGSGIIWLCWALLAQQGLSVLISAAICFWTIPDSRPGIAGISWERFHALRGYATWAIVSTISYRIRIAGPAMLAMQFFGPTVVAAYAIASQVAGYQLSLGAVVSKITQPALVSAEGRGDRTRVVQLINLVNKYSTLLILAYLVPVVLEAPSLLALWLGSDRVPDGAVTLVPLVMVVMALVWTFNGYWIAAGAINRFGPPVLISLACDVAMVVLAGLGLWAGVGGASGFWLIPAIGIVTMFAFGLGTVRTTSRAMGLPAGAWFAQCWLPVAKVAIPAGLLAAAWLLVLPPSWGRMLLVAGTYGVAMLPLTWMLAMGEEERGHFRRVGAALRGRLPGGRAASSADSSAAEASQGSR